MNRRSIRTFLCGLSILVGGILCANSFELQQGGIRIVLHEDFEHFTPYTRMLPDRPAAERWIPLLVDSDPRTSYATLLVNNVPLRLGDRREVRGRITETPEGIGIRWIFPGLEVAQTFSLVRSGASEEPYAVRVALEVTNRGGKVLSLGVRYTLDTYLGERGNSHFQTPKFPIVNRETSFVPDRENGFLLSEDLDRAIGLRIPLLGEGATPVERVVIANWRRLADAPYLFEANPLRNFHFLPFYINDSAVALFYPVRSLAPGQTRQIVTIFGKTGGETFRTGRAIPTGLTELLESIRKEEEGMDLRSRLLLDLSRIEGFIDTINRRVSDPTPATVEEIEVYRKVLEELTKRAKTLESN